MLDNVLSNLIAAVILEIIVLIGYLAIRRLRQRTKRRFFGIHSGRRGSVRLMLSNIQVQPRGTRGVTQIQDGFQGAAITLGEYEAALTLAREIETIPFFGPLRNWGVVRHDDLPQHGLCEIEVSPKASRIRPDFLPNGTQEESDHASVVEADDQEMTRVLFQKDVDTIILVGSSVYNSLSDYMLARREPAKTYFRFFRDTKQNGGRGIVFVADKPKAFYRRKGDDHRCEEFFVIQRTRLHTPHDAKTRTVFVCAGTGTRATMWAVDTLRHRWRRLATEHGDTDFAVLFKLETSDPEHTSPLSIRDDLPGEGPERRYPPLTE